MDIKRLILKSKDVSLNDYLSFFPMLVGAALSVFYKKKYYSIWGICERKDEARDNAYHFFKYMASEHPEQKCLYAIDKKCADYQKVKDLGDTVQFGSVKHWILYFTCKYTISSQNFMPNGYMCTFIERAGLFHPNHVFLQHGITKDKAEFLFAKYRRVKFFIAGAAPEYEFMKKEFGYPEGTMQYTGFARFDALHEMKTQKNRILIMPTWRKWLWLKSETHEDAKMDLDSSEYISCWRELLQSDRLQQLIDEHDLDIVFYPHPNMKGLLRPETFVGPRIHVADFEEEDLQDMMKSSIMLITDYSSVFFDMAYMKKPVIFYQFDEKQYRKYHYQQGWFDYHTTSFGDFCISRDEVLDSLEKTIARDYQVTEAFLEEHAKTFPLYDKANSKRIFNVLMNDSVSG